MPDDTNVSPSGEPVRIVPQPAGGHGFARPAAPHEQARIALPPYVIDPPDVLLIESTQGLPEQRIRGQHLIRPDGTIGLGIYGSVYVAGMTLDQAKEVIGQQLALRIKEFDFKNLSVDVLSYNSKFYYVITDGGGYGEQVIRFPITGSETVLDAISQIGGLGTVSSKKHIWVARSSPGHPGQQILPVDWLGVSLARFLSPIERVFGITLLGSSTVNSIEQRGLNNNR
jgi:polysaccharide export outer membrane protein